MWFRDIEVPQRVVDAHRAGTLVLFVGAGASLDPPSDLPSFEGLVAEIAAASREQSSGIEQVNRAVMQMDELTQQNAALVEQATASSQAMADQARELNEMMSRYQVSGEKQPMCSLGLHLKNRLLSSIHM